MELLRKEAGVIELTIQGNCSGQRTAMETDYNYELIVDPLLNKPAFVLNAEARILFAQEDHILFKSFVIYIFDQEQEGDALHGKDLKAIALDGRERMTELLRDGLGPMQMNRQFILPEPDEATERDTLDTLVAAGMRLN
ncbi:hypothetical protein [Taibaiella koreensis]|uniref:hypothetical protein n=1 Tax=Taibaiella koreensis TaxID=1268548 RepID=UPI000E59C4E3|nr:hypothetical protein [Taibaiella koreensis]